MTRGEALEKLDAARRQVAHDNPRMSAMDAVAEAARLEPEAFALLDSRGVAMRVEDSRLRAAMAAAHVLPFEGRAVAAKQPSGATVAPSTSTTFKGKVSAYLMNRGTRPGGPWMRWVEIAPGVAKWTWESLNPQELALIHAGHDLPHEMTLAELRRRRAANPLSTDQRIALEREYQSAWFEHHPPANPELYGGDAA